MNGEFKPVNEAADAIGVTARALYSRIKGGKWPALETRQISGRQCVSVVQAVDHFERYGRRPAGLRRASGSEPAAAPPSSELEIDPRIKAALTLNIDGIDLHELTVKLVAAGAPTELVRSCSQAANAIQKKRADTARTGKNVPPDDVVRMLRAHGELYVQEIEAAASRFAVELLETIRKQIGVDLAKSNAAAAEILANAFLDTAGNGVILSIRKKVEDQVRGVQILEGMA